MIGLELIAERNNGKWRIIDLERGIIFSSDNALEVAKMFVGLETPETIIDIENPIFDPEVEEDNQEDTPVYNSDDIFRNYEYSNAVRRKKDG